MKPDGNAAPETVLKIVSLQHPSHSDGGGQLQYLIQVQQLQPFSVEMHPGLLPVQDTENLFLIGLGIDKNLLLRHGLPSLAFSCGIADFCRKVPYHDHDGMSHILHLPELAQRNRVA